MSRVRLGVAGSSAGLLAAILLAMVAIERPPASPAAQARPSSAAIALRDGSGRPCPSVDAADPTTPEGGCAVAVDARPLRITVSSVLGDMDFARCLVTIHLHVDRTGRGLTRVFLGGDNPCNDTRGCDGPGLGTPAWKTRVEPAGPRRFRAVLDACFDTCIGIFAGPLRLDVLRDGDRWRARMTAEPVGMSGFRLGGAWRARTKGLTADESTNEKGERQT